VIRLGTRWPVGTEPPARLPDPVRAAIGEAEAALAGTDTTLWRWTLTWLEGKPVVELDDGLRILYDSASDRATIERDNSGEEWSEVQP